MAARRFGLGTLSARVIGLSALMTLAIIAAAFTLTYFSATRILEQETAEVVDAELRGIVDASSGGNDLGSLISTIRDRSVDESEAIYLLADTDGVKIVGNLSGWPADIRMDGAWRTLRVVRASTGQVIEIGAVAGSEIALPSAALRQANVHFLGSGQGSLTAAGIIEELPALAKEIDSGTFSIDAVTMPLAEVERIWNEHPGRSTERVVLIP